MSNLSIRTRLTATIVIVTAIISAIGVFFGLNLLEGQVREAAIDDRVDQFVAFGDLESFADDQAMFEIDVIDEFAPEFPQAAQEFGLLAFADGLVVDIPNQAEILDKLGSDGELVVWFEGDGYIAVSPDPARETRFLTVEEVGEKPIVPVADLLELGPLSGVFEDFDGFGFNEIYSDDLIYEYDQQVVDGRTVGFIAEVSDELDALDAIRSTLRNVVIALTILAGLATWLIAGRALRPVGAITDQVREITSGTLAERVPEPSTQDEVGVLARTMNTMLSRLENSDLRRRQFVSDASHELRTPVAVLRSEAEVAKRAPDSTTIDDFATVVLGESKRLEGLVEDLLSLARGDESNQSTATRAVDVDEIVLAEAARTRTLPIDKSAVSAGRVIGHEDDMQRVIAHLLDNAARHAESAIAVGVQTTGGVVRVWVDDDGPGVSVEDRKRIFERFIRLDDARTRDAGGAGLGLAVVYETVTRLNGAVEVLKAPLGGARFQIDFPAA